ncbi:MAG: hypothetical protein NDJ94_04785, partial [Vicinamibacteria bacterium]|nr:hypothetical protein [Vicinamibacteria bacterium]
MKKRHRDDLLAIVLGLACLGALGGLVAWFVRTPSGALDELDCPTPAGPSSNDVLLLDASDRLSDLQRDWVRGKLDRWAADVPRGGRARVFTLGDVNVPLERDFDRCNPGDGRSESWLTSNPDRLRKRWDEAFARPLREALPLEDSTQPASPLVEAIQRASVNAGLEPAFEPPRRLTVVSDLMQHSPTYSMYASGCADPEATLGANTRRWSADLSGVAITLLLVPREGPSCS